MVNALAAAVSTQTFIAHTAEDLEDEEMEVTIPHYHHNQAWAYPFLSSHSPSGTCPTPSLNPLGGIPPEDLGRRREGHTTTAGQGYAMAPFSGLVQQALDELATLVTATCMAITTFIIRYGPFSPLYTWPLPCNRPTEIPLPSLHTTRMSTFPSPEETSADGSKGMHNITPAFRVPPRPLLGGGHPPTS